LLSRPISRVKRKIESYRSMSSALNIENEQVKVKKFFENFLTTSAGEARHKYLEILVTAFLFSLHVKCY